METQLKIFKFHDNKALASQNTEFFLYTYIKGKNEGKHNSNTVSESNNSRTNQWKN